MNTNIEIALLPQDIDNTDAIENAIKAVHPQYNPLYHTYTIVKRAIDARARQVLYRLTIQLGQHIPQPAVSVAPLQQPRHTCIIVGAGPAGLFAALECIKNNIKPIVIERGKPVRERRRDLAEINRAGIVNTESNYCFGEGGAGTYSDGKLYTRSGKRGSVMHVLQTFVGFGASDDILIDARPHIGTNKLPQIITAFSAAIIAAGGEIHFDSKLTDIDVTHGQINSITVNGIHKLNTRHLILATGHSAHDIFRLLARKNILIEAKPFALGVRIEHPQALVDSAQYHAPERHPNLPPAYYSLVEQVDERGVFSFCMCPGGIIAPCATNPDEIVVNGWSPSKRNNPYANSGTVVQVNLADVQGYDPLRMLNFQQSVEKLAFEAGGGKLVAPAQRMVDFVNHRLSSTLPPNSYLPGTKSVMLENILPDFVSNSLKKALPLFGKKLAGYYTNEAILVGVESRTSSPVRIPRDKNTFQHPQIKGLYPCAEGAGYAGGIVSAAIDGINCVLALKKQL